MIKKRAKNSTWSIICLLFIWIYVDHKISVILDLYLKHEYIVKAHIYCQLMVSAIQFMYYIYNMYNEHIYTQYYLDTYIYILKLSSDDLFELESGAAKIDLFCIIFIISPIYGLEIIQTRQISGFCSSTWTDEK